MRSGDYDMLVFDELVYVLSYEMLPVEEVLEEIRARPRRPNPHCTSSSPAATRRRN